MLDPNLKTAGFSLREAAKQMVLWEDHLAHAAKQCGDCIHKHRLAAEAFCEEACTLDGAQQFPYLRGLSARVREARTHGDVRAIRKRLTSDLRARGLGEMAEMRTLRGQGVTTMLTKWIPPTPYRTRRVYSGDGGYSKRGVLGLGQEVLPVFPEPIKTAPDPAISQGGQSLPDAAMHKAGELALTTAKREVTVPVWMLVVGYFLLK